MRIISQDGKFDFPYEKCCIWLKCELVVLSPIGEPDSDYIYGKYSTQEKATKAMEMLREKYLSRMKLDGGYDVTNGHYVQPNFWVLPRVFQFPKDEEVEV